MEPTKPTVVIKHITPLTVCSDAIRQCHASQDKSDSTDSIGSKDLALIGRVGVKMKHESTLEHIVVQMDISNISRALLQEWSRHRIGLSQTVKSSRYTLGELREEAPMWDPIAGRYAFKRCSKYLVYTGDDAVDKTLIAALDNLRTLVVQGISNDLLKYAMPDAYKTSLTATINFRSLRNLLRLRTAPSALWEFRNLAYAIYDAIPESYKFLLEDCVYKEK